MTAPIDELDSILVATDGSDGALAGANRGIDLAATVGADVHALSVVDTSDVDLESIREADDERAAIEAEARAAVEAVATTARDRYPDLEVTTAVEHGTPFRAVHRYVESAGIDAIAMGTKGLTGLDRVVLGSVAENVLRTTDVPVLVVPPGAGETRLTPATTDRVLLPTDGSEGAARAVDWGVGLADALDATVHTVFSADTSRISPTETPETILSTLEETGRDALDDVRERATADGVSVTGTVARGPPTRVVLEYVETNGIDLVVMGTHGRSGVKQRLLGSVTENVVRNADVPVVCVPLEGENG